MCGRFTLILEPSELQEDLHLGEMPAGLQPRYNVAPTQPVAAVSDGETRAVQMLRWGLIPSWAKDAAIGSRLINARSETLMEKPSFRTAFARRRCLILADGFYEWYHPGGKASKAQPYFFRLGNKEPFAFAGLWDAWNSPQGEVIQSCTIITCPANDMVGRYHERMPVMLDSRQVWAWMDPQAQLPSLQAMLQPYPAEKMTAWEVSDKINSPGYDAPDCTTPVMEMGMF